MGTLDVIQLARYATTVTALVISQSCSRLGGFITKFPVRFIAAPEHVLKDRAPYRVEEASCYGQPSLTRKPYLWQKLALLQASIRIKDCGFGKTRHRARPWIKVYLLCKSIPISRLTGV